MEQKAGTKKILIAVLLLVVVAAALLAVWKFAAPQGTTGGKHITLQVVHGDGSAKSFALDTEEAYLGAALVAENIVVDDQGPYGLYVLTVDGETADEGAQEWWKLTKGGEMVNTGAETTPIADGETFELTLTVGYDEY